MFERASEIDPGYGLAFAKRFAEAEQTFQSFDAHYFYGRARVRAARMDRE
jgi:hypothetical protein